MEENLHKLNQNYCIIYLGCVFFLPLQLIFDLISSSLALLFFVFGFSFNFFGNKFYVFDFAFSGVFLRKSFTQTHFNDFCIYLRAIYLSFSYQCMCSGDADYDEIPIFRSMYFYILGC